MIYNPNSELVATNFIRNILANPSTSFGVGTTLPEDVQTWKDGFVQVQVVGGSPHMDIPERSPLVQIDCWSPSINGSRPKWGFTNTLAEQIIEELYELENHQMHLDLGNYRSAVVQSAYAVMEPRRITGDPQGHARYSFDISLNWKISENAVST